MRPCTRLVVSVLVFQIGLRMFSTSSVPMAPTGLAPIFGRA